MDRVVDVFLSHPTNKVDQPGDWISGQFPANEHVPNGQNDLGDRIDAQDVSHQPKQLTNQSL